MRELARSLELMVTAFRRLSEAANHLAELMGAMLRYESVIVEDDENATVVLGVPNYPSVDSAPHDALASLCWRCNAVSVSDDPQHCGACDACIADLRNGAGPKDEFDSLTWLGVVEESYSIICVGSTCLGCSHGDDCHQGENNSCQASECSCTQLELVRVTSRDVNS